VNRKLPGDTALRQLPAQIDGVVFLSEASNRFVISAHTPGIASGVMDYMIGIHKHILMRGSRSQVHEVGMKVK
jgi:hypothetical protein